MDDLSRSVIKLDGKDDLPPFMIDEYLVKSELTEDQYNTEERANHFTLLSILLKLEIIYAKFLERRFLNFFFVK